MKVRYTKEQITNIVKGFDVRTSKMSTAQLDNIISLGFAELTAIVKAFADEEIVDLQTFYDNGENKFTLEITEDVIGVYDAYVTIENQDSSVYEHGIRKVRDTNVIYLDNRYHGKVHVNLAEMPENIHGDNAIIKYYYTPSSDFEYVYMDQQTYLAMNFAFGSALYDFLHDVERSSQKRAGLNRTATAIVPELMLDANDPGKPNMFPPGV